MLFQVSREQRIEVVDGAGTLDNGVRPAGISHEVEGFAQFDQPVHQQFCALIMDIVVAGTMDQ